MDQYIFEFLGTLALVLFGDGVCAAVTLEKSKAKGAGWVVVTLGWGFAVMIGVFVALEIIKQDESVGTDRYFFGQLIEPGI